MSQPVAMKKPAMPQLVNTRKAAEILGHSAATLKRWRGGSRKGSFMKEYLTERELSEMIAVPRSTLRWRRFVGLGPAYVKFGRSVRYPVKAVREFMESNIHIPATLAAMED